MYCPECSEPIKRNAVISPNCKIQLKALVAERIENNEIIVNQKSIENQEIKYLMIPFIAIVIFLCIILLTGSDVIFR